MAVNSLCKGPEVKHAGGSRCWSHVLLPQGTCPCAQDPEGQSLSCIGRRLQLLERCLDLPQVTPGMIS